MFKVLFSLLFFINFLNSNQQRGGKQGISIETNKQDTIFKKVKFGFNIGYLGDLNNNKVFEKPLLTIKQDGISDIRVYEPFTKNLVKQPSLQYEILNHLVDLGFEVLLSLSNYPMLNKKDSLNAANITDEKVKKMSAYTFRNPPSDFSSYLNYLENFVNKLKLKNSLSQIEFEIGNEPDAKIYFWGGSSDFIQIARGTKKILEKYHRPIYCCGFTSEFANNDQQGSKNYLDFVDDSGFFSDNVNLSFHFYPNNKYTTNSIRLPELNNSIISEFNLFSYQTKSSKDKINYTNSSEFASSLIELLQFAYENDVTSIYLFKLVDNPGKEGALGFFDSNGNAKPSYEYFLKIYSVVKDGYKIERANNYIRLIGKEKAIVYALNNNVSFPLIGDQKIIDAYSKDIQQHFKPLLQKRQWVIITQ